MDVFEKGVMMLIESLATDRAGVPSRPRGSAARAPLAGLPLAGAVLGSAVLATPARAQCDPQEVAKLLPSDGAESDQIGWSLSVSGDTALVGSPYDDEHAGWAYVFEEVGGVWTEVAKLVASDGAPGDNFGNSVFLSGDIAVVGALFDDDNGYGSGSAYVFERIEGVWTEVAKLTASDGAESDFFGHGVSISGDIAAVAAIEDDDNGINSGSAYVFKKVGGVWTQTAKLLPDDGAANDKFGDDLAMSGATIVVGAPRHDDYAGSAYVFDASTGEQVAELIPEDGEPDDNFGHNVAIDGSTIIVGAPYDDDNGVKSGSAYAFELVDGVWTEVAKLTAADGAAEAIFGWSVSVSGDKAVASAPLDDENGEDSGSAYVFEGAGGAWTQTAKLLASDGASGDAFGASVSVSGDTALVGAVYDEDNGFQSGSAYVFDLGCPCPADINGDGELNVLDFVAFQLLWQAADPGADCDANAEFNVLDFVCFQQLFVQGCP